MREFAVPLPLTAGCRCTLSTPAAPARFVSYRGGMHGPDERGERARLITRFAGLSRRRQLLIGGIAVIVVAIGATVAAVTTGTGGAVQPTGTRSGVPAQDELGPVILVPGYGGSTSALDVLASHIRATGRSATVLQLPGTGTGSLIADAALLNATVDGDLRHGAPSVDVIGYSAGGVVALIWARRDDGAASARRIITLGSPFHGTQLATAAEAMVPGACPAACQQLVPGSQLLESLDVASSAGLPRWMSVWTSDDQVVTPPDSARLPGALDVEVQSVCPDASVSHSQLPTSPVVIAIVLQELGPRPMTKPSAAACG
jgi:triacylglycerol lipase